MEQNDNCMINVLLIMVLYVSSHIFYPSNLVVIIIQIFFFFFFFFVGGGVVVKTEEVKESVLKNLFSFLYVCCVFVVVLLYSVFVRLV